MAKTASGAKKASPRSVLDFFGISPRIDFHRDTSVTLSQNYVSFEDEEKSTWHGSKGRECPE